MGHANRADAIAEIEDALTNLSFPHGRGLAAGLCGAFYMSGLIGKKEWKAYLKHIPGEAVCSDENEPMKMSAQANFKQYLVYKPINYET